MASKDDQEVRQRNVGSSGEKSEPDRVESVPSDNVDSTKGTKAGPTRTGKKKTSAILWDWVVVPLKWLILLSIVALILYAVLKKSPIDAVAYTLDRPQLLVGPLAPNTKLQEGKRLLEGKIVGPESLAYYKGNIYTGTYSGEILRINVTDNKVRRLARLGVRPCGAPEFEPTCGRPLGIHIDNGHIYVVDAYLGLFEIQDGTGKSKELANNQRTYDGKQVAFANDLAKFSKQDGDFFLTDSSRKWQRRQFPYAFFEGDNCGRGLKTYYGKQVAFANDLAKFSKQDGGFYLTDSSRKWQRRQYPYALFEGDNCGRLLWYNPRSSRSNVALSKLFFPNGITMSPNEDFLLIAETSRFRILKYFIDGPEAGNLEVFADNLPGIPDNIRPSSTGGYWVGLAYVGGRMGSYPFFDFIADKPWIRNVIAKFINPATLLSYLPKYGMIIELDQEGLIKRSLHDPTGEVVGSVSEVLDTGDALYLGSFNARYLVKVDMTTAKS